MPEWIADFHWLRPWWLLAIVPGLLLALLWVRRPPPASGWADVIAPSLLTYLTHNPVQRYRRRRTGWLLGGLWLAACIGLAGPTASQVPQPLQRDTNALVILFDLSPSMRAQDIAPDRLTRARLKTIDLLRERREGMTGLVIYADDAFVVTPITPDVNTIIHLIPELRPEIMPSPGSHVEAALRQGIELLITGGHRAGRLLLVTDGVTSEAQRSMDQLMRQFGEFRLDILGVGTADGGPIPLPDGGFARDRNDRIVMASLPEQRLHNLASRNGGRYATLTPDDRDLNHLLAPYRGAPDDAVTELTDREFDIWHDLGYLLALLMLPLVVLVFRRGLVASTLLVVPLLAFNSPPAQALAWSDLWQRPDQRGYQALTRGDAEQAQQLFRDPGWRGLAAYQGGDFEAAAQLFAEDQSATGHYNRGNALAALGRFDEAIAAYEQALKYQPDMDAARHNRARAQELLEQQQTSEPGARDTEADPDTADSEPPRDDPETGESGDADINGEQETGQQPPTQGSQQDPGAHESNQPNIQASPETIPPATQQLESELGENPVTEEANDADSEATSAPEPETPADDPKTTRDPEDERMEQWLRRIPDDPGGLLQRQLQREAVLRLRESQRARSMPPGTEEERW